MLKNPSAIHKPSSKTILYNQFIRFIKIGAFLHIIGLFGICIFFIALQLSVIYFESQQIVLAYTWLFFAIWGITIPFFAELDAYGRYQNYKQIKESLFIMGYDKRLIKPFMHSKCQRDAVIVAAEDLGMQLEVKQFFYDSGYRSYHILPDAFMKNPLVLLNKSFWKRILFTGHYQLNNFYW